MGDIAAQADVDRLVAAAREPLGRIDVVANVAGVMDWLLPAHELDDATWRRVLAINVDGPMMLCRAVLPDLIRQRAGAIVNVASVGGLGGGAAGTAYTVSKHALIGLSQSIAWIYRADGIRCNTVCPGGVETNIGTTAQPRSPWVMERLAPAHALGGGVIVQPDQVATLISWLASEGAANVTGAIVAGDDGWRAA